MAKFCCVRPACIVLWLLLAGALLSGCGTTLTPGDSFTERSGDALVVVGLEPDPSMARRTGITLSFNRVDMEADAIEPMVFFGAQPNYCAAGAEPRCPNKVYYAVQRVPPGTYMPTNVIAVQYRSSLDILRTTTSLIGTKRSFVLTEEVDYGAKPSSFGDVLFEIKPGTVTYVGTFRVHGGSSTKPITNYRVDLPSVASFMKRFPYVSAPIEYVAPTSY